MKGITFFEEYLECEDCENGNPTHNPYHLPHTQMGFVFNDEPIPEKAVECGFMSEKEVNEKRGDYSWTQFAIQHCRWLEN